MKERAREVHAAVHQPPKTAVTEFTFYYYMYTFPSDVVIFTGLQIFEEGKKNVLFSLEDISRRYIHTSMRDAAMNK